jgi:very-short-patch-repair endonuclease
VRTRYGALPRDDASEIDWLDFEQSGILTYRQAAGLLGPARVRTLVSGGRWRSVCRGLLATTNGQLSHQQQLWVAVLAAGRDGVLAGVTAVAEAGVRGMRSDTIHVLIPATRAKTRVRLRFPPDMRAVVIHHTGFLPPGHRQTGRPPRTSIARAVVDAVGWARSDAEARLVIAAACQQRRVTPEEIQEVAASRPNSRRSALLRETVADVAGGAEALSEIDLVALCRRYRLPSPDLQERRRDTAGRWRYLDAYWRVWRLHVEVDGAHHMDARHWEADMLRQNAVWIGGDRILRFPAWLARHRPEVVAEQLRKALEAAGWRA